VTFDELVQRIDRLRPNERLELKQRLLEVAGATGEPPTHGELTLFLKKRLPAHMVPAAFVFLPSIPRTATGKVDRRALPEPAGRATLDVALVLPRNTLEEGLARIWRELLKLSELGVHDNFFVIGGQSLLAVQLLSRIRGELGVDLPMRVLFESPTVAELAEVVSAALWVRDGALGSTETAPGVRRGEV